MKQVRMRMLAAVAAWTLAGAASAAEQRYVAVGDAASLTFSDFVEVWGTGNTTPSRYVTPATEVGDPYHFLLATALGVTDVPTLSATAGPSLSFGYDPSATAYFTNATGRGKRYAAGSMTMSAPIASGGSITLDTADNTLQIGVSSSGKSQSISFYPTGGTIAGPLPGSTLHFDVPTALAATYNVDLVSLLGPTSSGNAGSFDLSAFAALPVRLTAPTVFRPVDIGVNLQRVDPAGGLTPAPPAVLSGPFVDGGSLVGLIFDGVFTVAVNAADYASTADYSAAKSWVDANIRQINIESTAGWNISTLTPVPEPTAAWLLLLGLPLVLARRGAGRPLAAPTAGR